MGDRDPLAELSTATGERSYNSNKKVAIRALHDSKVLARIALGLEGQPKEIAADCAEVFAMVTDEDPAKGIAYFAALLPHLDNKYTRARWEAMHALANIAATAPKAAEKQIPRVFGLLMEDESVIVRDHAGRFIGNYGTTSPAAAKKAWPLLERALKQGSVKQASKILTSLAEIVEAHPSYKPKAATIASNFVNHEKPSVRTAARALLRMSSK